MIPEMTPIELRNVMATKRQREIEARKAADPIVPRICRRGINKSPSCGHTEINGMTCAEIGNPHCLHPCDFTSGEV